MPAPVPPTDTKADARLMHLLLSQLHIRPSIRMVYEGRVRGMLTGLDAPSVRALMQSPHTYARAIEGGALSSSV